MILGRIFGASESIVATDTYQFEDYTKYVSSFSVSAWEEKIKRRKEVFPLDCEKAYQMGVKFAENAESENKNRAHALATPNHERGEKRIFCKRLTLPHS